jgi:hypothetical protein
MKRWIFWVLAPVMLGAAWSLLAGVSTLTTPTARALTYLLAATLIFITVGLANPRKFSWALRAVAAVICFAYTAYVIFELFHLPNSAPNLLDAIDGFLAFGVPSAFYASGVMGRALASHKARYFVSVLTGRYERENDTVVDQILDNYGFRRVVIIERKNGTFGFEEQRWSDAVGQEFWIRLPQRQVSVCDSKESAELQARRSVSWLKA